MSRSIPDNWPTALILAGGLGTRLRSVTGQTPKVLVEVQGRPFITYLLGQLAQAGFTSACISIGYGADMVIDVLGSECEGLAIEYCREEEPLGTGGAVRYALEQIPAGPVLVMNGDSIVNTSLRPFVDRAMESPDEPTLLAVKVPDISRYGSLQIENGLVRRFCEKGQSGPGWINAGVYYFPRKALSALSPGQQASLETDVLEKESGSLNAFQCDCEFIDIGTPESYSLGQLLEWMK
ncbi:nucleotidyltransferase family protein [Pseudodesulfovibrio sediminis]|uniref:D-glycero-D-manno-heptose 1-phosphate guanosyltransferase n=1 Tax=Pseudodesulfovibrio sediminis TaxID=2810563 RepID=A0ABM7P3U7_9BACT|nr:nucleotidyltransferase family protein [Pseudodesulfovibrio sediminis]BCS87503.1 D-glycero-D-manno-heptose 1-phosphate guanosyltransferase [Pseudodesulfovibrio sediminis]